MFLVYKNYEIQSVIHQDTDCFQIKTPQNEKWGELASSVKIAKKWIDSHIASQNTERKQNG